MIYYFRTHEENVRGDNGTYANVMLWKNVQISEGIKGHVALDDAPLLGICI